MATSSDGTTERPDRPASNPAGGDGASTGERGGHADRGSGGLFARLRARAIGRPGRRHGRVAIVRIYGPIAGAGRTADLVELLRRLRESRRVAAVVLDIDSPGGSATASDDLFLATERLAAKKPVVASIRGTGASGAYLAALAAKRIVAAPNAIVGSIGVIAAGPRVPRLLDRVGVGVSVTKAGRLKDMGAPWRDDSDEERAREQELVDGLYDAFVGRVGAARGLSDEEARGLATGEVWLGRQAVDLRLVDEVGDLERAVDVAADLAGVPARPVAAHLRRPLLTRLTERFAVRVSAAIADEIEARLWDRYRT